jgi:hypothetical protein
MVGPFFAHYISLNNLIYLISLNELVKNGKNGLIFETASQLALQLEVNYPQFIPECDF